MKAVRPLESAAVQSHNPASYVSDQSTLMHWPGQPMMPGKAEQKCGPGQRAAGGLAGYSRILPAAWAPAGAPGSW